MVDPCNVGQRDTQPLRPLSLTSDDLTISIIVIRWHFALRHKFICIAFPYGNAVPCLGEAVFSKLPELDHYDMRRSWLQGLAVVPCDEVANQMNVSILLVRTTRKESVSDNLLRRAASGAVKGKQRQFHELGSPEVPPHEHCHPKAA